MADNIFARTTIIVKYLSGQCLCSKYESVYVDIYYSYIEEHEITCSLCITSATPTISPGDQPSIFALDLELFKNVFKQMGNQLISDYFLDYFVITIIMICVIFLILLLLLYYYYRYCCIYISVTVCQQLLTYWIYSLIISFSPFLFSTLCTRMHSLYCSIKGGTVRYEYSIVSEVYNRDGLFSQSR